MTSHTSILVIELLLLTQSFIQSQAFPQILCTVWCGGDDGGGGGGGGSTTTVYPPTFTYCPGNIQHVAPPLAISAIVTFNTPTATQVTDAGGSSSTATLPVIQRSGLQSGSYFPEGSTTISFSATGSDGSTVNCNFNVQLTVYRCYDFISPQNGGGDCSFGPPLLRGGTCDFYCNPGYFLVGGIEEQHQTCDISGTSAQLSGSGTVTCQEITCAPLSPPTDGVIIQDSIKLNTMVVLRCNAGYNVTSGDIQRICTQTSPGSPSTYWTGQQLICTYVETCKSNPCQNNATCIDGLDQYTCNCGTYWTGTFCEIDTKPPHMTMCQQDQLNYTSLPSLLVSWQVPQFEDDRGSAVDVTSNYNTNSTLFPWGDWVIQYVGTKVTNGLTTTCEFIISVYPHPCVPLAPPTGGALACNGWNAKFGQICATFCSMSTDVFPPNIITDIYVCGATGNRLPAGTAPNCTESLSGPDYLSKSYDEQIHYYNHTCTDSSTQQQIATTYLDILKNSYFATMCISEQWKDGCTTDNVQIQCG